MRYRQASLLVMRKLIIWGLIIWTPIISQSLIAQSLTDEPLPADRVFLLSVRQEGPLTYSVSWDIAEGYYLYRDKIAFYTKRGEPLVATLSANHQPQTDQFFGTQEVYYHYAYAQVRLNDEEERLSLSYQGCWQGGLCYPVQQREILLRSPPQLITTTAPIDSNYGFYLGTLNQAGIPLILFLFFLAGLGLTFTPCVLPMLPIISGTLTMGQKSFGQKTSLALTYILVMALTYSLIGLLSGWLGYRLHSLLGSPFLLVILATLVSLLALSMFGLVKIGSGLRQLVNKQFNLTTGSYKGAVLWGMLSPLIIGTCLSAPLAAALLYLAERGNPLLGAAALFVLAIGMGVPLLLFVVGLGKLLPPSGRWLEKMRHFFGYSLILLALFIVSPLLPNGVFLVLGVMTLVTLLLHLFSRLKLGWALASSFLVATVAYGVSLWIDFGTTEFNRVTSVRLLQDEQQQALRQAKPTMVYYYADWCISCREIEWLVFKDEAIVERLKGVHLIKADITQHNDETLRLLDYYDVLGPPSFVFIDSKGLVRREFDLVGHLTKRELQMRLASLLDS